MNDHQKPPQDGPGISQPDQGQSGQGQSNQIQSGQSQPGQDQSGQSQPGQSPSNAGSPPLNPYVATQQNLYGAPPQSPYGAAQQNSYGAPPRQNPYYTPYVKPTRTPYSFAQGDAVYACFALILGFLCWHFDLFSNLGAFIILIAALVGSAFYLHARGSGRPGAA